MAGTTKQLMILTLAGILCVFMVSLTGCKKETEPPKPTAVHVGDGTEQTVCPVMEGSVNKELFVEYKGKKVYFCCPGCEAAFLKEPEKYLDKLPQFK